MSETRYAVKHQETHSGFEVSLTQWRGFGTKVQLAAEVESMIHRFWSAFTCCPLLSVDVAFTQ